MYTFPIDFITGQGLGITGSSKEQIGSLYPYGSLGQLGLNVYTNVTNGNVCIQNRPARTMEAQAMFELGMVYNSNDPEAWRLSVKTFQSLPQPKGPYNNTLILKEEDGHESIYTYDYDNKCYFGPRVKDGNSRLEYVEELAQWRCYHHASGAQDLYNPDGTLQKRMDAQGHTITFTYANGKLKTVESHPDTTYTLEHSNQFITITVKKNGVQTAKQVHTLNSRGLVEKSEFIGKDKIETVDFIYPKSSQQIEAMKQSDGTEMSFYYNYQHNKFYPNSIKIGNGKENNNVLRIENDVPNRTVKISDTISTEFEIVQNEQGKIKQLIKHNGFQRKSQPDEILSVDYHLTGEVSSITHPDKTIESFDYSCSDPLFAKFGLLTSHILPNNERHHFHYNMAYLRTPALSAHSIQANAQSPELATYYVYDYKDDNTRFLRFEISPTGTITEHRADKLGFRASTRRYIHARCDIVDKHVPTTGIELQVMLNWLAVNVNPQQVTLTEFNNDLDGQVLRIRQFATINAKGEGIEDAFMYEERITPDEQGYVTRRSIKHYPDSSIIPKTVINSYDDLKRLKKHVNELSQETDIVYSHEDKTITKILANDRREKIQLNSAGIKTSESVSVDNIERNTLINLVSDRPNKIKLPDGRYVFPFYDLQLRLSMTVSSDLIVTEHRKDVLNRFEQTYIYAKPFDQIKITPPEMSIPQGETIIHYMQKNRIDSENDRSSYKFFDTNDRVQFEVDAEQYVTEYRYDAYNNVTHKICYAERLSAENLEKLKHGQSIVLAVDLKTDRTWQKYYNKDGKLVGEKDPAGFLTEYKRDFADRITQEIHYTTPNNDFSSDLDLEKARPVTNQKDAHTFKFYDARNQVVSEVDAEGYITSFVYLPNGLLLESTRHMEPVSADWFTNPAQPDIASLPKSSENLVQKYEYDACQREVCVTESNGKQTRKTYNEMGQILSESVKDISQLTALTPDFYKGHEKQYDKFGQVVAEANAFIAFKLAKIDASNLTPEEKTQATTLIWEKEATRYTYELSGLKTQMRDTLGNITYYYYDNERRPTLTIDPTGAVIQKNYNSHGQVELTRQYEARLSVAQMQGITGGFINEAIQGILAGLKNDVKDSVESCQYDRRGNVLSKTDAENNTTLLEYNAFNQVTLEIQPVNDNEKPLNVVHEYNTRGLEVKTIHRSQDTEIKTEKEYNSFHHKPTALIDELDSKTALVHDKLGRIKEKTDALQATYRFTYDALSRPKTETDPLKHTTEHQYNQLAHTHTIIHPDKTIASILTKNIFGQVIQSENGAGKTKQWTHAEDSQIQTETDEMARTHTNIYDTEGLCKEQINPDNVKTTLGYNAAKQLTEQVVDVDNAQLTTSYEPNALGNNVVVTDARGIKTVNTYDRNQRLATSIKDASADPKLGLNLRTETLRNKQGKVSAIISGDMTQTNQYQKKFCIDAFNRLTGTVIAPESLNIITAQKLDKKGNVIAQIDANDNATFHFYNEVGQKRLTVDPAGSAIEYQYHLDGTLLSERVKPVNLDGVSDNSSLSDVLQQTKNSSTDKVVYHFYDENGRERFTLCNQYDAETKKTSYAVIESFYDKASRINKTTQYADLVELDVVTAVTADIAAKLLATHPKNRTHQYIFDAVGNVRFEVSPSGKVTEHRYNQTNKEIATFVYANRIDLSIDLANLSDEAFYQYIKLDSKEDRAEYKVYDSLNRMIFKVDGEQHVTLFDYNENSQPVLECKFDQAIDTSVSYELLCLNLKDLTLNEKKDRITKTKYDAAGRVVCVTDSLKAKDSFKYDVLGNELEHTDRNNNVWTKKYDAANRLEKEIAPALDGKEPIVTKRGYDNAGNLTNKIEAMGTADERAFEQTYDKNNLIKEVIHKGNLDPNIAIKKDVSISKVVRNAKHQKVAESDLSGQWTFYIYDAQDKLSHQVNPDLSVIEYKRNAFGEVECEIHYALPLDLHLNKYIDTGLAFDQLEIKSSPQDHIKEMLINNEGQITRLSDGNCITDKEYNTFAEVISESNAHKANPSAKATHYYWHSRNGKLLATCGPNKQVKRLHLNHFDEIEKQEAIYKPLSLVPADLSLTDLDKAIVRTQGLDSVHVFEHDLLGQITAEKRLNVRLQKIIKDEATGRSILTDVFVNEVVKSFEYSATQKQLSITFENGSTQYFYYDNHDNKIAQRGVARQSVDENGKPTTLIPLTHFDVNALGQTKGEVHYKKGAENTSNLKALPKPLSLSDNDQRTDLKLDKLNRSLGQVVDPNKLKIESNQTLNQGGKIICAIDANGNAIRKFYDACNRLRFEVNALGNIKEWQYDAFGNISFHILLTATIKADSLTNDSTLHHLETFTIMHRSNQDSVCQYFYDVNNNERLRANYIYSAETNTTSAIMHLSAYDSQSKLVQTVQFAKPIDVKLIQSASASDALKLVNANADIHKDRATYIIRDESGFERFIINPMGCVTELTVNSFGQVIQSTIYATAVHNREELAKLPWDKISAKLAKNPDEDRTTYTVFNAFGKKDYIVYPDNHVSRFGYDMNQNFIGETLFDAAIDNPHSYDALVDSLRAIVPNPEKDRTITHYYDAANQPIRTEDALNYSEQAVFDIFGNQTKHIDAVNATWETRWDNANRPYSQIAPKRMVTHVKMVDGRLVYEQEEVAVETFTEFDKAGLHRSTTVGKGRVDERKLETKRNAANQLAGTIVADVALDDTSKASDFSQRPETVSDVETTILRDAKNQKIAEKKSNQFWHFHVRDSLGRLIYTLTPVSAVLDVNACEYKVTRNDYNAFNEVETKHEYATSITLNPSLYIETGIPASVVKAAINLSENDRGTYSEHDLNGNVISIKNDSIFYLSTDKNEEQNSGFLQPETQFKRNLFGDIIHQAQRQSVNTWSETFKWFNKKSQEVLVCESAGEKDQVSAFKVTAFEHNGFNEEVSKTEYAKCITVPLTKDTLLADVKKAITATKGKDRKVLTQHDLRGQVLAETRVEVPIYEAGHDDKGLPLLNVVGYRDLTKSHEYSADKLEITVTHEDGVSKEHRFYDACKHKIAQTDITRNNYDVKPDGKTLELVSQTPLTTFGVDAHGKAVVSTRFKTGTSEVKSHTDVPAPIAVSAEDQTEVTLTDNRGLAVCHQDPEGILKGVSFNASQQPVRTWGLKTTYQDGVRIQNMDEKRVTLDAKDRKVHTETRRNNAVVDRDVTNTRFNLFDEPVAQDFGKGKWEIFNRYNKQGQVWMTNSDKGATAVTMRDLKGNETAFIQSSATNAERDLETISEAELPSLLTQNAPIANLEIFLTQRDSASNMVAKTSPACYQPPALQNIPLQIQVLRTQDERHLLWPVPHKQDVVATKIKMRLPGEATFTRELDILTVDETQRCKVDISALPVGNYEYEIDYFMKDVNGNPTGELKCQTAGAFVCKPMQEAPAVIPNNREMTASASISVLKNKGTIVLDVPEDLQKQTVLISCSYGSEKDPKVLIKKVPYHPVNGYQVDFEDPFGTILSLNLTIMNEHHERFTIYHSEIPQAQEELLHLEDVDNDWDLADHLVEETEKTIHFETKNLLYITHLPDKECHKQVIEFKDVSLDYAAHTSKLKTNNNNIDGVVLDVTNMAAGRYPFNFHDSELTHEFVITQGGEIYPSTDKDFSHSTLAVKHHYEHDRWDNISQETDSLNNVTTLEHNDLNQVIQRQEPAVEVVLPDRSTTVTRPTTITSYTSMGGKVAVMDPNGNTQGFELNAAGQTLSNTLGDNTVAHTHAIDPLNNEVAFADAAKNVWQKKLDRNGLTTTLISPSLKTREFERDEDRSLIRSTDEAQQATFYGRDTAKNVVDKMMPNGQHFKATFDRNHEMLEQSNPDGFWGWERDPFGNVLTHLQFSTDSKRGAVCTYTYNRKKEVTDQNASGGDHGRYIPNVGPLIQEAVNKIPTLFERSATWSRWRNLCDNPQAITPPQHIQFQRVNGRLIKTTDFGTGMSTAYQHDTENRIIATQISQNGTVLRNQSSVLNAAGWEVAAADNELSVGTAYDAASNRRFQQTSYVVPQTGQRIVEDNWNEFDRANRILSDKANSYEYELNRRLRENSTRIFYDVDNLLEHTEDFNTKKLLLSIRRDLKNRVESVKDFVKDTERKMTYVDGTDWAKTEVQTKLSSGQEQSSTEFKLHNSSGSPKIQETHYDGDVNKKDISQNFEIGFEGPQVCKVERVGSGAVTVAYENFDSNGSMNSMLGLGVRRERCKDILSLATTEGRILEQLTAPRMRGKKNDNDEKKFMEEYYRHIKVYYGVKAELLASVSLNFPQECDRAVTLSSTTHHSNNDTGGFACVATAQNTNQSQHELFLRKTTLEPITSNVQLASTIDSAVDFSDIPLTYEVCKGDTYESISQKLFLTSEFAMDIAAVNGDPLIAPDDKSQLEMGDTIRIPQLCVSESRAGQYLSYYKFSNSMREALLPFLALPKPHEHHAFLQILVRVITVAVICIVAPQIGPFLMPVLAEGGLAAGAFSALMGATLDAAAQGIEIKLGLEKGFSTNEVIETAFTAGIIGYGGVGGAAAEGASAANHAKEGAEAAKKVSEMTKALSAMQAAGESAVGSQLTEMMTGSRKKFDIQGVLTAVASSAAGASINMPAQDKIAGQFAQNAATTIAATGISSAMYWKDPNLEEMLAQAIGTEIAQSSVDWAAQAMSKKAADHKVGEARAQQRNRAGARQGREVEHAGHRVAQQKAKAEKSAFDVGIDVSDPQWGQQLKEIASQKRIGSAHLSEPRKTGENAPTTSSTRKIMDYVDAFNGGVEKVASSILQFQKESFTRKGVKNGFWRTVGAVNGAGDTLFYPLHHPIVSAKASARIMGEMALFEVGYDVNGHGAQYFGELGRGIKKEVVNNFNNLFSSDAYTSGEAIGNFGATVLGVVSGEGAGSVAEMAAVSASRVGEFVAAAKVGIASKVNFFQPKLELTIKLKHQGLILQSGGRQLEKASEAISADKEALDFYNSIRATKTNDDVTLIARNSGFPEYRIQRIKEHLFIKKHILSEGRIATFDPCIEIADAWVRLQEGNFVKQDIQLLNHEYFESRLEGIFKTDYRTAHNLAVSAGRTWNPDEFISEKLHKNRI